MEPGGRAVLHDAESFAITYHRAAEDATALLISFGDVDSTRSQSGFGTDVADRLGWDHLYVAQQAGSDYHGLSLQRCRERIAPHVRDYEFVLVVGAGLGGWAALHYGAGLPGARLVALWPCLPRADVRTADQDEHAPLETLTGGGPAPLLVHRAAETLDAAVVSACPAAETMALPEDVPHSPSAALIASLASPLLAAERWEDLATCAELVRGATGSLRSMPFGWAARLLAARLRGEAPMPEGGPTVLRRDATVRPRRRDGVPHRDVPSVDALELVPGVEDQILAVDHRGVPIHLRVQDRGQPVTVVFFHGALPDEENARPGLVGSGLASGGEFNRVSVADPTLLLDPQLMIGWYAGSQAQPDLQEALDEIIRRVVAALPSTERVILFGSSAGGFAALRMAASFPESLAIVVNPQTAIGRYYPPKVSQYLSFWGAEISSTADLPGSVVHDLTAESTQRGAGVLYVQNSRDMFHRKNHLRPFLSSVPEDQPVWLLEEAWGQGGSTHVRPPTEQLHEILTVVVADHQDWPTAAEKLGFRQRGGSH